ncbi:Aste57867_24937 [Aphanomyces stellatus]|uniref:Aste57867_24937 protein n=1 Tax=Aphanomyces stellatus TaxID=120398 RepID=A0A485LTV8_9STRA|nr:hypothetical protein As57867_024859 [Aphanomyces stellatus]VFU01568.1 Aste57867_24937 [Aphanomyces stellatus]
MSLVDRILFEENVELLDPTWFEELAPPPEQPEFVWIEQPLTETPENLLALACDVGCIKNALMLLGQGVDPNKAVRNGKSALEYAMKNQNGELIRLLLSHGATLPDTEDWEIPKRKSTTSATPSMPNPAVSRARPSSSSSSSTKQGTTSTLPVPTLTSTPSTKSTTTTRRGASPPPRRSCSTHLGRKYPTAKPSGGEMRRDDTKQLYYYERRPADPRERSKSRHNAAPPSTRRPSYAAPTMDARVIDLTTPPCTPTHEDAPSRTSRVRLSTTMRSSMARRSPSRHRLPSPPRVPSDDHRPSSKVRSSSTMPSRSLFSQRSPSRPPSSVAPSTRPFMWHPSMEMCVLFVSNIDASATDGDLQRFFSTCGQLRYFRRGWEPTWAHVTFALADEALRALELNGAEFRGRRLRVTIGDKSNSDVTKEVERRFAAQVMPSSPKRWSHDLFEELEEDEKRRQQRMRSKSSQPPSDRSTHGKHRSRHTPPPPSSRSRSKSHYRVVLTPETYAAVKESDRSWRRPGSTGDAKKTTSNTVDDTRSKSQFRRPSTTTSYHGRSTGDHKTESSRGKNHHRDAGDRSKSHYRAATTTDDRDRRGREEHRRRHRDRSDSRDRADEKRRTSRRDFSSTRSPSRFRRRLESPRDDGRSKSTYRSKSVFRESRSHYSSSRTTSAARDRSRSSYYGPREPTSTTQPTGTASSRPSTSSRQGIDDDEPIAAAVKRSRSHCAAPPSSSSGGDAGRKRARPTDASGFKIIVSNVSRHAESERLRRMFSICGTVADFHRTVLDGVPQTRVRVTFETAKARQKALALDGLELCDQAIRVALCSS